MANIKSAKKRILVNQKKADRNKSVKSATKTAVKKVYTAIEAGDSTAAATAFVGAASAVAKAGKKGVYHKNKVASKISRLAKAVNKSAL